MKIDDNGDITDLSVDEIPQLVKTADESNFDISHPFVTAWFSAMGYVMGSIDYQDRLEFSAKTWKAIALWALERLDK
jgi:hypothetical protein